MLAFSLAEFGLGNGAVVPNIGNVVFNNGSSCGRVPANRKYGNTGNTAAK